MARLGDPASSGEQLRQDWEWFFARYERAIRVSVRSRITRFSRGSQEQDLQDAEQEVWLLLQNRSDLLARWDPKTGRFRQWLQGIILNACRTFCAHAQRGRRMCALPEGVDAAVDNPADAEVDEAEQMAWIRNLLEVAARRTFAKAPRTAEHLLLNAGLFIPELTNPVLQSRDELLARVCAESGEELESLSADARKLKLNAIDKGLGRARETFHEMLEDELRRQARDEDSFQRDLSDALRYLSVAHKAIAGRAGGD